VILHLATKEWNVEAGRGALLIVNDECATAQHRIAVTILALAASRMRPEILYTNIVKRRDKSKKFNVEVMKLKTPHRFIFVAFALLALLTAHVHAQTFEKAHATEIVIGGNYGTDIYHTITLAAPDLSGYSNATLTLPGNNGVVGALTNDGTGALTWEPIGAGSITAGSNNTFLVTNGSTVVAWSGLSNDATLTGNGIGTPLGINLSNANTWLSTQNFSAGLTSAGGITNIATTDNSSVNIGTGTSTNEANAITIGNGDGASAPFSTTVFNGLVNITATTNLNTTGDLNTAIGNTSGGITTVDGPVTFNGTVTLPAATLTAGDLALADANILVGNGASPSVAAPVSLSQDATMNDLGKVTISAASSAEGFTVTHQTTTNGGLSNIGAFSSTGGVINLNTGGDSHDINIGTGGGVAVHINMGGNLGVNNIQGATTIGSTSISQGGGSITSGALTVDDAHSMFVISTGGTVTSFSGVTATTGRIILLINGDPSNTLLLTSGSGLALNGDDVAMGPRGSATLMYNGTTWILLALQ
jgi:fibronectin-binding autotransporter adhesin